MQVIETQFILLGIQFNVRATSTVWSHKNNAKDNQRQWQQSHLMILHCEKQQLIEWASRGKKKKKKKRKWKNKTANGCTTQAMRQALYFYYENQVTSTIANFGTCHRRLRIQCVCVYCVHTVQCIRYRYCEICVVASVFICAKRTAYIKCRQPRNSCISQTCACDTHSTASTALCNLLVPNGLWSVITSVSDQSFLYSFWKIIIAANVVIAQLQRRLIHNQIRNGCYWFVKFQV